MNSHDLEQAAEKVRREMRDTGACKVDVHLFDEGHFKVGKSFWRAACCKCGQTFRFDITVTREGV